MNRSLVRAPLMASLLGALLAGCRVGPNYAPPAPVSSAALDSGHFVRAVGVDSVTPAQRWWDKMDDPQLSALIDEALRSAPTMAAAEVRVRQAPAGLREQRAAQRPSVNPSFAYVHAELPGQAFGTNAGGTDIYNLGFDANWEIDIWGAKKRKLEKSRAEAQTAEAQLADAQVSLTAEVARTYVELRAAQASFALLDREVTLQQRLTGIARQRFERGTSAELPVEAARGTAIDMIRQRDEGGADVLVLRDTLAVLTGASPGALDRLADGPVPLPPSAVAIGDPAGLLSRRPDIRAADRRFAAATAQIGIEDAKRYPTITLLGLVGIGGNQAGDIFDFSRLTAIAIPRLSWKFLDFGRIAAARRGAEAGRDAALADYRQSVLVALRDAEAALTRFGVARQSYGLAQEDMGRAVHIADLQDQRTRAGTISEAEAIEAQQRLASAEIAATHLRADLTINYVALTKALGLGWQDVPHLSALP